MIEDRENTKPFPLVPVIGYRKADEHNTFNWHFHWMFFKVWSRDAFDFEIALTMDTHWGIGVTAQLPYLRVVIAIPCPEWLDIKIQKYLWRKPKQLNNTEQ